MTQRLNLMFCILLVWVPRLATGAVETPRGEPTSESRSGFESLGDELLQDLPLPKQPQRGPTERPPVESINAASSPLERVEYGMRQAQDLLAIRKAEPRAIAVQHQVVSELDSIIDQLRKAQCKACQASQSSQPSSSRRSEMAGRKPSTGLAKSSAKSPSAASSTAQQSSNRLGSGQSFSAQNESVEDVLKRLWGQLPERVREQMLQTPADEFLPKYRADIEKYFRRLAEENSQTK